MSLSRHTSPVPLAVSIRDSWIAGSESSLIFRIAKPYLQAFWRNCGNPTVVQLLYHAIHDHGEDRSDYEDEQQRTEPDQGVLLGKIEWLPLWNENFIEHDTQGDATQEADDCGQLCRLLRFL